MTFWLWMVSITGWWSAWIAYFHCKSWVNITNFEAMILSFLLDSFTVSLCCTDNIKADWVQCSLWNMTTSWPEIVNFDPVLVTLALIWVSTHLINLADSVTWPSFLAYQWWFRYFKMGHLGLIVWWCNSQYFK